MPQEIVLRVNGQLYQICVEADTPLLYVLRNDLGLKGAKFGCGLEQCGACKVLVDGEAVPTCRLSVGAVQDREIVTVEGLGTAGNLHPLQQAFVEEGAVQCGFCTPGLIVTAKALLDRCPNPSEAEIRAALADNLCRCGVYDRVRRAIQRAAGKAVTPAPYELVADAAGTGLETPAPALSPSLAKTPDLDAWIHIEADGTVTLFTGKVELGQDLKTSIALIGAEELDVSLERIRIVTADTAHSPDEGYTVSSMSLETSGNAIRQAAAEVRQIALAVAHEELEVPLERLSVSDGTIADPVTGRSVTYWDLFGGKRFGSRVTGRVRPKAADTYQLVGRPAGRLDLRSKVTGAPCFVHDLDLPGMLRGRVVRPPDFGACLVAVDEAAVGRLPGVRCVVRDGSFLGVVAEREEQAVLAADALHAAATWEPGPSLPAHEDFFDRLLTGPDRALLVVDGRPVEGPVPPIEAPDEAVQTLTATYYRPYHLHASLGPSAAVAHLTAGQLTVWTHSQGVYPLRAALAQVLAMSRDDIRVIHLDGPGCYGHNGADDAALDAALLARAVPGQPISLQWSRADEHGWEPYGPATAIRMQASLGRDGAIADWNHDVWGYSHIGRAGAFAQTSGLLAAWHLERPFERPRPGPRLGAEVGIHRNANPLYAFPRRRIVKHFVPDSPLRTSSLRGLGAYANIFAIESFMDELASAAKVDPLDWRLRYLADERARAVVQAAAEGAGWRSRPRPSVAGRGRGLAFARYKNRQAYVAVVVELHVDRASGQIRLERAIIAADAGQIVNPDGLSNQLEGALVQAASWTLVEEAKTGPQGVRSLDWDSYPILRFPAAPQIETVLLNRPGQPYLGIGEGAQGPVPAAIANAVFDAIGVRLRRIPFRPERVRAALVDLEREST